MNTKNSLTEVVEDEIMGWDDDEFVGGQKNFGWIDEGNIPYYYLLGEGNPRKILSSDDL